MLTRCEKINECHACKHFKMCNFIASETMHNPREEDETGACRCFTDINEGGGKK